MGARSQLCHARRCPCCCFHLGLLLLLTLVSRCAAGDAAGRVTPSSSTAAGETTHAACVVEMCEQALVECEGPLNANLSAEADCKTKGYLQVRRRCFSSTWRMLLQQAATERTGAMNFTDDFFGG
ncbi:unnamed protein product [Lampetra planeri]